MIEWLIWATAILFVCGIVIAYVKFRDVFHPLLYILPMSAFIYVYMPLKLIGSGDIFGFVSEEQLEFVQFLIIVVYTALIMGCIAGSSHTAPSERGKTMIVYDRSKLHSIAYTLTVVGFAGWLYTIIEVGGFSQAFGRAYGGGWSSFAYIRESVYLLIAAVLLLMSREGFDIKSLSWRWAIALCSIPWLMKGFLGARRGPTFVIFVAIAVSWYFAKRKRPSLIVLTLCGMLLGSLLLFLVSNRGRMHLGSSWNLTEFEYDVSASVTKAGAANEYIFSAGCITAARHTGMYFWGKRILAQFVVRPIPRQLWPTKYEDFGISEILQNAGVSGIGLQEVMGWSEVPGAAGAFVADLWVEFSWLAVPAAWGIGWGYGYVWKRAITDGVHWVTQYMILTSVSVFLITQGLEAVLFRFIILSVPTAWVWWMARRPVVRGRSSDKIPYAVV